MFKLTRKRQNDMSKSRMKFGRVTSLLITFGIKPLNYSEIMADCQAKLKILCIHGYRQNAQSFRERTGAFRKIPFIKKQTELVFITAPNQVPPVVGGSEAEANTESSEEQTGWWFSKADRTYMAQDYTDCCPGYEESLQAVQQAFKEQGPFDGIISFSQGAAFATLLCGLREQDDPVLKFDFVIFVAGFKSRQSAHEDLYRKPFTVPSLHVFGDTDKVIQKEMSENLLQYFVEPKVLQHEGGHFIPVNGPTKKVYTEFLQDMLNKKVLKCQTSS